VDRSRSPAVTAAYERDRFCAFPHHSLENVGESELQVLMVEIKQRSDSAPDGT